MIQQANHQLFAINSRQQSLLIDLRMWSLLGMGQGHIILKNNDPSDMLYWKVLMICIHQIHSAPKELQSLYLQLIEGIPSISKYLLPRQLLTFAEEARENIKVFVSQQLKILHKLPQNFNVYLAENLNRSKDNWQYTFQFKPKTPLPDKYSSEFFNKFCNNLSLNPKEVEFLLNNRPPQQKTRWYKKSALKTNKKNMNPLQIFSVLTNTTPSIINKVKKMDTFSGDYFSANNVGLNETIFNQIVKSQILSAILAIQLLFVGPSDTVQTSFNLWNKSINKAALQASINEKVKNTLNKQLHHNQTNKLQQLLSQSIISDENVLQEQSDRIEQMFRFLMSWSWRDVSLFIQLKLNSQQSAVQDIRFTIIDYQLKQTSKLAKTIQKDQQFLKYYLKYLQIIP